MNLVALDPGLLHPAIALFHGGVLIYAARVELPKTLSAKTNLGARVVSVARHCQYVVAEWFEPLGSPELVFEWPQVYRAAKSKGDPNDLLPLAGICGALSGVLQATLITSYTPAEWIGQLPKGTTGDPRESPRGTRIWSRLTHAEQMTITLSHDAIDAVGLGLHHLGRLKPKRVLTSS